MLVGIDASVFLMPQVPGAFGPTAFAQLRVGAQLGVRL
jgi:hypothetical protein